jgi:hypothetical protein
VRKLTEEAFGSHFVIDPTAMTHFRIRLSGRAPADPAEEQALDERSRHFHRDAKLIVEASDGVQAFTGLVSALMSLPHRILLVDEPEAFLHPPLARRLGRNLSALASERSATLVVATHSADFVMGCVESGVAVHIVRLTYDSATATARTLQSSDLMPLMRDPLLRSTGALRGLFHRAVMISEADADRAFYDEINSRLQESGRGVTDALVVNAQNWQTVPRIMQPLRRLGIPALALVDLDTVSDIGSSNWQKYYDAAGLPVADAAVLEQLRIRCRGHLDVVGRATYKSSGVGALTGPQRGDIDELLAKLRDIGVFVVSVGELERWLSSLSVSGPKKAWIVDMLTSLGSDPTQPSYVAPGSGDVWEFLDEAGKWARDSNRHGMP